MSDEGDGGGALDPDPERAAVLREAAEDIRTAGGDDVAGSDGGENAGGDDDAASDEAEQVAALLYRISDCFDPDEEATPADVYRNMRTILRVRERGTLERDC